MPILIHAGRGMPPVADESGQRRLAPPRCGPNPCPRCHLRTRASSLHDLPITQACSTTFHASSRFGCHGLLARVPARRVVLRLRITPYGRPSSGLYLRVARRLCRQGLTMGCRTRPSSVRIHGGARSTATVCPPYAAASWCLDHARWTPGTRLWLRQPGGPSDPSRVSWGSG